MPIADPNNKDIDRVPRYHVRAGKKVFKIVSSDRQMMESGNQRVAVRCVVVKDLERESKTEDPPTDYGMSCDARLWNTERGAAGMARFARALKYMQAFDTDDDDLWLNKVVCSNDGVFVGTVKVDSPEINGKVRHYSEIESFAPYEGEIDAAWQVLADKSYEEHAKAVEERAKREAARSRGGGYRRKSGGGAGASESDPF